MSFYTTTREVYREDLPGLLDEHEKTWDTKKGGAWWAEDFMAKHSIWFTDFRADLNHMLKGWTPAALNNMDELKKHMLKYLSQRLIKGGSRAKNTPKPEKASLTPKAAPTTSNKEVEAIIANAASKNEAMSLLRKEGFNNTQIAGFMGLKPGRVASGIGAFDKKKK